MFNKTEFIKWFNEVASAEEVMKIFLFYNDLLGTNFDVENIQLLNNSLYKVLSLNSNKDDILN